MENFLNFLKEYKELLVSILCVVLTFVSILVKRKPKTLDEFLSAVDAVLVRVPGYVSLVERPSDGALKKSEVINLCRKEIVKYLQRDLSEEEDLYFVSNVSRCIEAVLVAPQKKEVSK